MKQRRRNPLDPLAWEHEPYPAGHERQRHLKIGVHTSLSFDIAVLYGVVKAGLQGPLDDDEPNCAVVFEIDTTGLPKDYDIDATYAAEYGDAGLRDLVNEENVKAALLDGDVFPALDAITHVAEGAYFEREGTDSWDIAMWQEVSGEWSEAVLSHLRNVGEDDPDRLHDILLDLLQTGRLDPRVWAEAIQQYRYHEPIGLERIIRITAIRPVENTLLRDYEDDEEDEGPQQFAEADAWEGYAVPDKVVLWQNPQPGPQQLSFGHVEVQAPEYHGTDLKRARAAFPELREYLVSPWPYTQPTI